MSLEQWQLKLQQEQQRQQQLQEQQRQRQDRQTEEVYEEEVLSAVREFVRQFGERSLSDAQKDVLNRKATAAQLLEAFEQLKRNPWRYGTDPRDVGRT